MKLFHSFKKNATLLNNVAFFILSIERIYRGVIKAQLLS